MKNMKHRIQKIEDALRTAYLERRTVDPPSGWSRAVMAQVFAKGPRSHHQHLTFLANLRSVWRFTAVTCAMAMALFFYALGHVGTPDQLAIMFFSDNPLPMMTMELMVL